MQSTILRVQFAALSLLITWKKKCEIPRQSFSWGHKPDPMDPKMNPTEVRPTHPVRWQHMPHSFIICLHAYILEGSEESPHVTHTSKGGWMDHLSWVQELWWWQWWWSKSCRPDWIYTGSSLLSFLYMEKTYKTFHSIL